VRLVRRDGPTRGFGVLLLGLALAAVLALRAAATGPGGEPADDRSTVQGRPTDRPGIEGGPTGPTPTDRPPTGPTPTEGPRPEKLHPLIVEWLAVRPAGETARVIVTFQGGAPPPETELSARHGARVLERFWINNGALVELPLGQIPALAARPDVGYVQPEEGGEPPPA
jgi:hypothetical protein